MLYISTSARKRISQDPTKAREISLISTSGKKMFNSTFSPAATSRWKGTPQPSTDSTAISRRIRSLIRSQDASKFIDTPSFEEVSYLNQDEVQEVSSQLKILRKNHDRTAILSSGKQSYIQQLKQELQIMDRIESRASQTHNSAKTRISQYENELNSIKEQQKEAELTQNTYSHMLERMKQQKIFMERRAQKMNAYLRQAGVILNSEYLKMIKTKEARKHASNAVQTLEDTVHRRTREQTQYLRQLETNVEARERESIKRDERAKRQLEIMERAANEDRDKRAQRVREGLLVHRLWLNYLNQKQQMEMEKSNAIEEAFQRIRSATGLMDVDDIVERFLTREQTYTDLLDTVSQLQDQITQVKTENEEYEKKIHELDYSKHQGSPAEELREKIAEVLRELMENKQKHTQALIVNERVGNWIKHSINKFKAIGIETDRVLGDSLTDRIEGLKKCVYKALEGNQQ